VIYSYSIPAGLSTALSNAEGGVRMKKKSTAEYAEILLGTDKNKNYFMNMGSSLPFGPPGLKTRG
jgi:hypothetical protein